MVLFVTVYYTGLCSSKNMVTNNSAFFLLGDQKIFFFSQLFLLSNLDFTSTEKLQAQSP